MKALMLTDLRHAGHLEQGTYRKGEVYECSPATNNPEGGLFLEPTAQMRRHTCELHVPEKELAETCKVIHTLEVTLAYDQDTECPIGMSGDKKERIVSFNRRHVNFGSYDEFFDAVYDENEGRYKHIPKLGLRNMLKAGTAFMLAYYEHGLCRWSLSGEGPQCQWDSVQCAGVYILPSDAGNFKAHDTKYAAREAYARSALDEYTDWCNGTCFYYSVELDGEDVESCGGYIGDDYFFEEVAGTMKDVFEKHPDWIYEVTFKGDAKDYRNYHTLPSPEHEFDEDDTEALLTA